MVTTELLFIGLKLFMAIPFVDMTDSSEDMTGLQFLHRHLSSSKAELVLPSREFSLNVTKEATIEQGENFVFKLTNGKLLQASNAGSSPGSRESCQYRMNDAISCYISIIGWCATYDGEVKHPEFGSARFVVTIILKKYELPLNPADIWIYMKFAETSSGRYTSTTPSDFVLDMSTKPHLMQLDMFKTNDLPENTWDKLKKIMRWDLKMDIMNAMMTRYKTWVEKEVRY
ncbi:uncharacterized protein LOC119462441 [Dermacentor silvarum]|uniref:uncharacterized protein LOC119462441 n=1 Tax=Dermacentor silvarum TaxID=543639 RepID=UPI001897410B|nr:uncharacterized protein LOC119462441 [Dermacentor silvarum]